MYWYSTGGVRLHSLTPQDCVNVISQLVTDIQIYLYTSSPESTVLLLSQIHQTKIRELLIVGTSLDEQHMYCITQCLLNNQLKRLYLFNTKLTSNLLSAAVSINTSLERVIKYIDRTVTIYAIDPAVLPDGNNVPDAPLQRQILMYYPKDCQS